MFPEYELTGKKGVGGKYYQAYRQGHTVKMYVDDVTVSVRHFTLEEGAIMLEPGVRGYFRTSESVNQAVRCLITSIPKPWWRKQSQARR
jgi:hypothetical protein